MKRSWIWIWRYRLYAALLRIYPGKVMYIGGSETLPAPLNREEEAEWIAKLETGSEEARNHLIEHNLRLVA